MFNLDPSKLLIIAVVAIILLGPDRLPAVARQVGGAWRSFTAYRHKMESQVREAVPDLPSSAEIGRLARSPAAFLDHLSTLPSDEATPESAEAVQAENAAPSRQPAWSHGGVRCGLHGAVSCGVPTRTSPWRPPPTVTRAPTPG